MIRTPTVRPTIASMESVAQHHATRGALLATQTTPDKTMVSVVTSYSDSTPVTIAPIKEPQAAETEANVTEREVAKTMTMVPPVALQYVSVTISSPSRRAKTRPAALLRLKVAGSTHAAREPV